MVCLDLMRHKYTGAARGYYHQDEFAPVQVLGVVPLPRPTKPLLLLLCRTQVALHSPSATTHLLKDVAENKRGAESGVERTSPTVMGLQTRVTVTSIMKGMLPEVFVGVAVLLLVGQA